MTRVLERLAAALVRPADVRELDLSGGPDDQLEAVPKTISKLVNLEVLRLDGNMLTELPEAISKLKKLRELHAANNQITSEGIHRTVWFIKSLEVLNLHGNRIAWVDNLGNYQKSPLSLYLGSNPLDTKAYKMGGSPVHPLWKHVLHMFPLTTYGKPKLRALALDVECLKFPLPKEQMHFEPPFPHVERIQIYGKLDKAQRDDLAKMFPKAAIEVYPKASGPHLVGTAPPAELPPPPKAARPKAWNAEQLAFQTKLLAAAKAKKLPLDQTTLRPCIAIATRPPKKKLAIGASRLGGLPDLPAKHAWPLRDKKPMLFVAQLRLEDLAPYDPESLLPPRGLLSFFVADFDDPYVIYLEDATNLVERTPPSPMMFGNLKWKAHPAGALDLEGEVSSASYGTAGFIRQTAKRKRFIHRVLGHDFGDMDMPLEDDLVLLLAIGSDDELDMNWGDAGTMYFAIERDALARRDFAKVELLHTM